MDEILAECEQLATEAKVELIYWATSRTKIYLEKEFAKNYTGIKARLEKNRKRKDVSTRFRSTLKVLMQRTGVQVQLFNQQDTMLT